MKLVSPSWIKRRGGVSRDLKFSQAIWHFSGSAHFRKRRLETEWYGTATLVWVRPPNMAFEHEHLGQEVLDCRTTDMPGVAFQIFDEWFWRNVSEAVADRKLMKERELSWRNWINEERAQRQKKYQELLENTGRPVGECRDAAGLYDELRHLPR